MEKAAIFCLAICGTLLAGCGDGTVTVGGLEGVIFPADQAHDVATILGQPNLAYWTPSPSDVSAAGPEIRQFLEANAPSLAARLTQYNCQYFGIVVGGQKRIYCNFLGPGQGLEDWKSAPHFIMDGGDRFFHLEYDIASGRCLNLTINGNA